MAAAESGSTLLIRPEHDTAGPHTRSAEDVLKFFAVDLARGLSAASASELRTQHGYNELAEAPPVPLWRRFVSQFNQLVIWILIVAAAISGAMGEWTDALAILAIVLLNAILGFLQEEKAEHALAALQKLSAPLAKVLRDGVLEQLPARELVPGDCIELEAGDYVPADARLIEAFSLRVQEAALTGESVEVFKLARAWLRRRMSFPDVYSGSQSASQPSSADGGRVTD